MKVKLTKRAVSPVIAIILLIGLTLAAVGIVFLVVLPMMRGTSDLVVLSVTDQDKNGNGYVDSLSVQIQNLGSEVAEIDNVSVIQDGSILSGWRIDDTSPKLIPQSSTVTITLSTSINSGEAKGLHEVEIAILTKSGKVYTYSFTTSYHEPQLSENDLGLVAIYNDTNYPVSWISTSARDALAAKIKELLEAGETIFLPQQANFAIETYTAKPFFVDAANLKAYMEHHPHGFIVMASDVAPDTIFSGTQSDGEFVETWLEGGGTMMWIGDWPFYYVGKADGSRVRVGSQGARWIFDTSSNVIAVTNRLMTLTLRGEEVLPDFNPFYSYRPADLTVLQSYGYSYDVFAKNGPYVDPVQFQPGSDANGTFIIAYGRTIDDSLVNDIAYVATKLAFNTLKKYTPPTIVLNNTKTYDLDENGKVDTVVTEIVSSRSTNILGIKILDATTEQQIGQLFDPTTPFYAGIIETEIVLDVNPELDIGSNFKIVVEVDYNFDQLKDFEYTSDTFTVNNIENISVAIFYSELYANSWVSQDAELYIAETMYNILNQNGIQAKIVSANLLKAYMIKRPNGTIALTGNVPPNTIFQGESDGSLIEQWIVGGGTVIIPGDWMFYYYAQEGSLVRIGSSGLKYILNTSVNIISTRGVTVQPTQLGKQVLPSLTSYSAVRTVMIDVVPDTIRIRVYGSSGTYGDPVQLFVGEGSIFYAFTFVIDKAKAQLYKVPEVLSEFVLNMSKTLSFNATTQINSAEAYEFNTDNTIDYILLNVTNVGTDIGKVIGAYVNGVAWDAQGRTLIPGLSTTVGLSTSSSTISNGSSVTIELLIDFDGDLQSDYNATYTATLTSTSPQFVCYYDSEYWFSWIREPELLAQLTAEALTNNGYNFVFVDAKALRNYMNLRPTGTVVMLNDVFPETVWNGQDNSFVEQWLDNGGKIIQVADWPFYYVGYEGGGRTTVGSNGARRVFDASLITTANFEVNPSQPFNGTWRCYRPVSITALNNNGITYYSYGNNTDATMSDPTLFKVGSGWFFYIMNTYISSSLTQLAAENIVAALEVLDTIVGI